jgi:hypothetical protein
VTDNFIVEGLKILKQPNAQKQLKKIRELRGQLEKKNWKEVWNILNEEPRFMEVEEAFSWLKEILKKGFCPEGIIIQKFYERIMEFSCELEFDESEADIVEKLLQLIKNNLNLSSITTDRELIEFALKLCEDNEQDKYALEELLGLLNNSRINDINPRVAREFVIRRLRDYSKEELGELWKQFENFQHILYAIDLRFRDHIIHSIRSYIFGIALLNFFRRYTQTWFNQLFSIYGKFIPSYHQERDLLWCLQFMSSLAFFFHDIGYPIEKIRTLDERIKDYFVLLPIYEIGSISVKPDPFAIPSIDKYLKLLATKAVNYPTEDPHLHSRLLQGFRNLDHGVHAALGLMDLIQRTVAVRHPHREKYEEKTFKTLIAFAAQAIAIHNIKELNEDWESRPFSFVVSLADALQEWKRPYHDFTVGLIETIYKLNMGIRPLNQDTIELTLLLDLRPGQQEAVKKHLEWYDVKHVIKNLFEQLRAFLLKAFCYRIIVVYIEGGRIIVKSFGSDMKPLSKLEEVEAKLKGRIRLKPMQEVNVSGE